MGDGGVDEAAWVESVVKDVGMGDSSDDDVETCGCDGAGALYSASCCLSSSSCCRCSDSAIRMSFASRRVRGRVTPVNFAE